MASVNKVILVGNLGADPETRFMPNGDPVCNLRLATTDSYKDKGSGERKEAVEPRAWPRHVRGRFGWRVHGGRCEYPRRRSPFG